jgi:hypothetical protein
VGFVTCNERSQGDVNKLGWQPVYRTEVKFNNLNPVWQPVVMRMTTLNNGDPFRPLLLKVLIVFTFCR